MRLRVTFLVVAALLCCTVAPVLAQAGQDRDGMPERIGRQLSGGRCFEPVSGRFFLHAVDTLGLVPAIFATSDRITRASRVSRAGRPVLSDDGVRHEGVNAYRIKRWRGWAADTLGMRPEAGGTEVSYAPVGTLSAAGDFDFFNYLIDNGRITDAMTLSERLPYAASDTLWYMRAWGRYYARDLRTASDAFSRVGRDSPLYDKALFFNVVCKANDGYLGAASELLDSYDGPLGEVAALQRAGLALLRDEPGAYRDAARSFVHGSYALGEAEDRLQGIYDVRYARRGKSPLLAAAASAVVPGLGKIYAGRTGEGISSLFTVGSLAAITAESWHRCGADDWKTILFGALGSIFYIGNIYGSYVSVGIYNDDLRQTQNAAVLYSIHIPLRSIFP